MTPVREFHLRMGQPVSDWPVVPDQATLRLRLRLITEEFSEVAHELRRLSAAGHKMTIEEQAEALRRLLKEMCDLRYVLDGTAVSLGLPIDEAFEEVHRSNMSKLWKGGQARYDDGGKVMKPPTYSPADMSQFVSLVDGTIEDD